MRFNAKENKMKSALGVVLIPFVVLSLVACEQAVKTPQPEADPTPAPTPALVSGIDIDNMDTSIRPGDDFFRYVNGNWLKNNPVPDDRSSYQAFSVLHDAAQENVRDIIEAAAASTHPIGSDEQKVGDLFTSFTDMEARNKTGLAPLHRVWDEIDAVADHDELAVLFASMNQRGYNMPFGLDQYADFQDPNFYMIHTWQGGLGLPDREYYLKEGEKDEEIRTQYVAHVVAMLNLAGLEDEDAKANADLIMQLETRMAAVHMPKEETRNIQKLYNRVNTDELDDLMPNFNWSGYLETSGVDHLDWIVVTMLDHMQSLDGIIVDTSVEDWKIWLKWISLHGSAAYLTEAIDQQHFSFFGTVLTGREEQRPLWRRGVNIVNANLGEVVGKVYVKKHFPPEAKARMQELVANLVKAYEVSIRNLEWMGEETRAEALDKLSKFDPKIGYPDVWRDYSALTIKPDDLYGNIRRSNQAEYQRKLDRQGKPVDRNEWQMNPQTVNAYYNPPLNEIVFPPLFCSRHFLTWPLMMR